MFPHEPAWPRLRLRRGESLYCRQCGRIGREGDVFVDYLDTHGMWLCDPCSQKVG